jgi:hypothetical protein
VGRNWLSTLAGSLAAATLVTTTQILTTDLDSPLFVAVTIFAFSMPMLVLRTMKPPIIELKQGEELNEQQTHTFAGYLYIIIADLIGFAFVFFHFGILPGLVFVSTSYVAFLILTGWKSPKLIARDFFVTFPSLVLLKSYRRTREWIAKIWKRAR